MTEQTMPHALTLSDRKKLTLTGIAEVVSFDDATVVMRTDFGDLIVQGQQLQLKTLNPDGGSVTVEGEIAALFYEQKRVSGRLGRLFR